MHFATLSLHNVVNVTLRREKLTAEVDGRPVEWLAIAITDDTGRTVTVHCYDTPVVDVQCTRYVLRAADEVVNHQPSADVINLMDALKRTLGDITPGNHPAPDHWSDHPVQE